MQESFRNRIGIVLAAAFIGFLIWSTVAFQGFFAKIVPIFQELSEKNNHLSILIFILLGTVSTMLSSFSSVPLIPVAIVVWGGVPTALYLFIGWIIGDMLAYFVGYSAGNPLFKRLLPLEKVEYYRKKIPPNAEFRLVFFFIMSMPSEVPNYVLGTLRYNFYKYLAVMALGEFIFSFLTAYAGRALVQKNFIVFSGSIALFILFFSYFFYLFNRYLHAKDV